MFQKVISLAPESFRGYSNLGGAYLAWGRYADAIPALEKSLSIRPTPSALNNMGVAYFYSRRFDDAAKTYERAATLDANDYRLVGNLAECYERIPGKHAAAVAKFKKAIELGEKAAATNPRDGNVLSSLAVYYASLDDRAKAAESLRKALAASPKNMDILFGASLVYTRLGDDDRALEYLKRAFDAGLPETLAAQLPNFDRLSANPKFPALLQEAKSKQKN
jgi:tetratricopeptide (TPR) repeat protein